METRSANFNEPARFLERVLHLRDLSANNRVALSGHSGDGNLTSVSYGRLPASVATIATSLDVGVGDRVALIGPYGPDWVIAFLGILARGAIAVPLDRSLGTDELGPMLRDADPALVVVGGPDDDRVRAALRVAGITARTQPMSGIGTSGPLSLPTSREPADPAVIAYTAGTTGAPKGVTISWSNLCYQVATLVEFGRLPSNSSFVSTLPAYHMLELVAGCLCPLYAGAGVHYPGSSLPADIVSTIAERRATHLVVVPLLLTALRRHIESELARGSGLQRAWTRVAARLPFRLRRLALVPLRARLGGRLHTFFVGGAPLDRELGAYFERLGFHVCQGYGMSEASPIVSGNTPWRNRLGSAGQVLPGTEVRVDGGEILVRGPGVMAGYWRRPELTAAAVDDEGWLHTGDKGFVDGDGYLFVTGRTKNLIVLANGENVQPEEVEAVIQRSELIGSACVLSGPGAAGEQIFAVVTASEHARVTVPDSDDRQQAVVAEVRRLCADLARHKRPNRIVVHDRQLPQTPTRKIRRGEVHDQLSRPGGVLAGE